MLDPHTIFCQCMLRFTAILKVHPRLLSTINVRVIRLLYFHSVARNLEEGAHGFDSWPAGNALANE